MPRAGAPLDGAIYERILTDGLVVDVPAEVPTRFPNSSSEFFIRNIDGDRPEPVREDADEIGAGCGIISLYMAANWTSKTVATDISPIAVQATLDNAELNGLVSETAFQSDLFEKIEERQFDLIVFNTPMIDKTPENDIEKYSLCDLHGLTTENITCGRRAITYRRTG